MTSSSSKTGQYSRHSILRYEKIFGPNFVSTGGLKATQTLCERLRWKPGMRVLDIGSGLGGADFYMAHTYGAFVIGVDLSEIMIEVSTERAIQQKLNGVTFFLGDVCQIDFPNGFFDLIWSRDCFLHIADKPALLSKLYRWTAPGGQILVTDYARRAGHVSAPFAEYVEKSAYNLLDIDTYAGIFRQGGYSHVVGEDHTDAFIRLLHEEQAFLREHEASFLQDFTQEDFDYLLQRWANKVEYCNAGDMKFAWIYGQRPA